MEVDSGRASLDGCGEREDRSKTKDLAMARFLSLILVKLLGSGDETTQRTIVAQPRLPTKAMDANHRMPWNPPSPRSVLQEIRQERVPWTSNLAWAGASCKEKPGQC